MNQQNLEALIQTYFDGDINEQELKFLEKTLNQNTEVRKIFAQQAVIHGHIYHVAHGQSSEQIKKEIQEIKRSKIQRKRKAAPKTIQFPIRKQSFIAAAIIICAIFGFWSISQSEKQSQSISLAVNLIDHSDQSYIIRKGQHFKVNNIDAIYPDDQIQCEAPLTVRLANEQTTLMLETKTRLSIHTTEKEKLFTLHEGSLFAQVAKQKDGDQLRILTPQGQARVIGTAFLLNVQQEQTLLNVSEGTVALGAKEEGRLLDEIKVSAGQKAHIQKSKVSYQKVKKIDNLIKNPGFESSALHWESLRHENGDWFKGRNVNSEHASNGNQSLQIQAYPKFPRLIYQDVALPNKQNFLFTAQYKTQNGNPEQTKIKLYWHSLKKNTKGDIYPSQSKEFQDNIIFQQEFTFQPSDDWTEIKETLQKPKGASKLRVELFFDKGKRNEYAFFDDLSLITQ